MTTMNAVSAFTPRVGKDSGKLVIQNRVVLTALRQAGEQGLSLYQFH